MPAGRQVLIVPSNVVVVPPQAPKPTGPLAWLEALNERSLGMLMTVPAVAMLLIVAAYPVLSAMWLSLHRYNVKVPDDKAFIGFDNFVRAFQSPHFWDTMTTTTLFTVISVALEFGLGLALALVMNKGLGKLTGIVRVSVLVPWATITVVTALAFKWLFTPGLQPGAVGAMLTPFLGEDACMLCGQFSSLMAMVIADTWKTAPFIALLLLAGLQTIDQEMYEAADVDGASTMDKFLKITLPSLKPAILVAVLFRTLDAFRMFDLAYVMTGGANSTETVSMLGYKEGIQDLDLGMGSAIGVIIFACVFLIAIVFTRVLGADINQGEK